MIIYLATNLVNNKQYIGQTIRTLEERIKSHISKRSGCRALKSALNKYGLNFFKFEIIDQNGVTYNSTVEAARILNLKANKISLVLHGKRNHTGGYKFKFIP